MVVDKIKPLKYETPTDGTEFDFLPTEAKPSEDYIAAKGIAFENDDDIRIEKDGDGDLGFIDDVTTTFQKFRTLGTSQD